MVQIAFPEVEEYRTCSQGSLCDGQKVGSLEEDELLPGEWSYGFIAGGARINLNKSKWKKNKCGVPFVSSALKRTSLIAKFLVEWIRNVTGFLMYQSETVYSMVTLLMLLTVLQSWLSLQSVYDTGNSSFRWTGYQCWCDHGSCSGCLLPTDSSGGQVLVNDYQNPQDFGCYRSTSVSALAVHLMDFWFPS